MKQKILRECITNYWYWLREVSRIPTISGSMSGGTPFRLHRGNLAMNFLFVLNKNMFVELPRQHGKTTAAVMRYLWVFNYGTTNSEIMFIHKNHDGSKENLMDLKEYRESLPSYLRMDSIIGSNGQRLKAKNTAEVLMHPTNGNRIKTLPSARNKALANTLGRGCTQPLQYYDEFGWILHNKLIYESATPAFDTAAQVAKANGGPFGIVLTTTPGDLTTSEGEFAFNVRNNATPFREEFYDFTFEQINQIEAANSNSSFFLVSYSYKQLGSGEEYFARMVKQLGRAWDTIRREVLLEWNSCGSDCPFSKEDLDVIQQFCHGPIRSVPFGPYRQYAMDIYKEMDPSHGQLIGVDVSGGFRRDSSAITLVDATTTEVTATLNCNYMPVEDLAMVIYELVTKYMPNALVVIEKNGVGIGLLSRLIHTSIKRNLYYEIKDRVMEERYNGVTVQKGTQKVKAYGVDNSKAVRSRMIEILFSRVQYHKDKFIAPILHAEMSGLTYRTSRNGNARVDHSVNTHDDQIFSYLMAMYVWYDCNDLTNRFGIIRGEIRTDADLEERVGALEDLYGEGYEVINVDDPEYTEPVLQDSMTQKFLKEMVKPTRQTTDIWKEEAATNEEALQALLKTPYGRQAVSKAYNIDLTQTTLYGLNNDWMEQGSIPQDFYDEWYKDDDEIAREHNRKMNGNLYQSFMSLDDNDF